jgi:hypothetical protein
MTCIAYSAPAGLVASMVVKRTQHFKYIIVVGWALLAAGMGSNVSTSCLIAPSPKKKTFLAKKY